MKILLRRRYRNSHINSGGDKGTLVVLVLRCLATLGWYRLLVHTSVRMRLELTVLPLPTGPCSRCVTYALKSPVPRNLTKARQFPSKPFQTFASVGLLPLAIHILGHCRVIHWRV